MFRNTQLLRRSGQSAGNEGEQDSRPVGILADPYEVEAGILAPVLARFGFRVLKARDGVAALELARHGESRCRIFGYVTYQRSPTLSEGARTQRSEHALHSAIMRSVRLISRSSKAD
jgi:hypothetical protein